MNCLVDRHLFYSKTHFVDFPLTILMRFSLRYFLRAVGLGTLNAVFNQRNSAFSIAEPRKRIVTQSFWVALQRCMVHLLPCTASIVIIALNLRGFFIGFELAGIPGHDAISMAALQVTAKLQELLIIASIGSVLYHRIRYDLLHWRGVPFGLLGSGLSFTQISYLWSPEFLSGITCKLDWPLYVTVFASAIIASTAGPATAVLVIPRVVSFPAGYTTYYINGTRGDLWPDYMEMSKYLPNYTNAYGESIDCSSVYGYTSAVCPSGGYTSLLNHFSSGTFHNRAGVPITPPHGTTIFAQSVRGGILIQSPRGQVAAQTLSGQVRGEDITETFSYGSHGATANLQVRLNYDWYRAAQNTEHLYPQSWQVSRFRFYAVQRTSVASRVPAVRVLCHEGQNLTAESTVVSFPNLPADDVAISVNGTILSSREVEVSELATSIPSNKLKTTWFDLRSESPAWDSVSYGLILEAPWNSDRARQTFGCSIDARWADADVWTRFPGPSQSTFKHTRGPSKSFRPSSFLPVSDGSWQQIRFSSDWLKAVNFDLPQSAPGHTSEQLNALEAIITESGIALKTTQSSHRDKYSTINFVEYIVASVLTDAISRVGSFRSYNTSQRIDDWALLYYDGSQTTDDIMHWSRALRPGDLDPIKHTEMGMRQSVTGYGYQASTSSDVLALLVLFSHLLLALVHSTYVLCITHRTSSSWDTFGEMIALAQQSSPSEKSLYNTCAGIERMSTYRERARVKVCERDPRHLELAFDSDNFAGEQHPIDTSIDYGGRD